MELGTHFEREDLGNGRYRHIQHMKPIAYRSGMMKRIANQIGASKDATLTLGTDELVQFRVRDKLAGNSPVVHFGKGESHVKYTPLGTNNVDGTVSRQSMLFRGAWDNADLRLTIAGHRLQKDILLMRGHPKSFSFRIDDHAGFDPLTLKFGNDFRMLEPVLIPPDGILSVPLKWQTAQSGGKWILSTTLPDGDYAGWTLDPTLILQPDAADGIDTYIRNTNATIRAYNHGISETMLVFGSEPARAIVKLNLSVPVGAKISSAILNFVITSQSDTTALTIAAHRSLVQFFEGAKDAAAPDAGQDGSTWNLRNANGSVAWAGGVGGAAGSDWASVATDTVSANGVGSNFDLDILADVAGWHNGSVTNHGLWLLPGTADVRWKLLGSSDNPTPENRLKLTIEYSLGNALFFGGF